MMILAQLHNFFTRFQIAPAMQFEYKASFVHINARALLPSHQKCEFICYILPTCCYSTVESALACAMIKGNKR